MHPGRTTLFALLLLLPLAARADISAPASDPKYTTRSAREMASAKLSQRAVDAISTATTTPSLYDRHTAPAPSTGFFS